MPLLAAQTGRVGGGVPSDGDQILWSLNNNLNIGIQHDLFSLVSLAKSAKSGLTLRRSSSSLETGDIPNPHHLVSLHWFIVR